MFQNREEAGELLAEKLKEYKDKKDAVVLAIPRGGVVTGMAISSRLNLPLDVIVVKKLGAPGNSELAIGAVSSDGTKVVDAELSLRLGVDQQYLDEEVKKKIKEIKEREKRFRIKNQTSRIADFENIILTDDGVATGSTCEAAIKFIRIKNQTSRIKNNNNSQPTTYNLQLILAVPVIAKDTYRRLKPQVDELIALEIPEYFGAVGQFYREFEQVSDEEVIKILRR